MRIYYVKTNTTIYVLNTIEGTKERSKGDTLAPDSYYIVGKYLCKLLNINSIFHVDY